VSVCYFWFLDYVPDGKTSKHLQRPFIDLKLAVQ
jgi:hypothetical protein